MPYPLPPQELPPVVRVSDLPTNDSKFLELAAAKALPPNTTDLSLPDRLKASKSTASSLGDRLKATKSAASLGMPVSVGYAIKSVDVPTKALNNLSVSSGKKVVAQKSPQLETPSIPPQTQLAQIPVQIPPQLETPSIQPPQTQPAQIPVQIPPQLETPSIQPPQTQPAPERSNPSNNPQPQNQPATNVAPPNNRVLELNADRQEYDQLRQIVTAEGNVLLRLDGGVVDADSLQVNLANRIAVGQGNVAFTRGEQVLRGERFTYNFVQNTGELQNARGEIFVPTVNQDFSPNLATDVTGGVDVRPPSDRITANQPLQGVTSAGGVGISVGAGRDINNAPVQQGGTVRRLRFQAQQVQFYPQGWQAQTVRITNDPFSPPELELRADKVTLTRETPFRDRIRTTRQRLVFDQGLSIPIPRNQTVIDRSERQVNPGLFQVGIDGDERGGVFIERGFTPISTEQVQLQVIPQFFAQEAITKSGGNIFNPDLYGVRSKLRANLGARTSLRGSAALTSIDLSKLENNLRASLRLSQIIGTRLPHLLTLEYSYRDRLFNGSLGYQTVQSSIGGILTSPIIPLGRTGIALSYQAGAQLINADSDRLDLIENNRQKDRVSLSRLQGSVALNRGFNLWQGKGLAATPTQGLRYTPTPVIPYVQMFAGLRGVSSLYSSGDSQNVITGTIGVRGQFGHFSRRFLDYTGFNVSYSQDIRSGLSPFLFDRAVDNSVLGVGLVQQIYGPFRLGIQASLNLSTGENISTDYVLEYSRRTYGVALRYNPILGLGALSLRISDFNWTGGNNLFTDSDVKPVVGGVRQFNE